MRQLVGISGKKGHGKDTFARLVREVNPDFEVAHFAGALKKIAAKVFGLTQEQMFDPVIKEAPLETPIDMDQGLSQMSAETDLNLQPAGKIAKSPRELMQFIGTEYVRKAQPNYWIQRLIRDTSAFERVLVPDTRFPNEADAVRTAGGGKVIKVVRIDMEDPKDAHPSETEIDKIDPDLLIGVRTGNLSLPQRIAYFVATGDFESARMFDFRAALDAIHACASGTAPWEAAMLLPGIGDKVSTMFTLLEYYTDH